MMITVAIGEGADRQATANRLVGLAEAGGDQEIREALALLHPADVAELLDVIERVEIKRKVFGLLAPDVAPTVLTLVTPLAREKIVQQLSVAQLQEIALALDPDDAADLLALVSPEKAQSRRCRRVSIPGEV